MKELDQTMTEKPRNEFVGLDSEELDRLCTVALENNDIEDYDLIIKAKLAKEKRLEKETLEEYIDCLFKKREFTKLNDFLNGYKDTMVSVLDKALSLKLNLVSCISQLMNTKDLQFLTQYKKLRSSVLFTPNTEVEEKVTQMMSVYDDFIITQVCLAKTQNEQFGVIKNSKVNGICFLDNENVKNAVYGDQHMLLHINENLVLGYGSNTKNQLLPLSSTTYIDKACYLPSVTSGDQFLKARKVFAKFNVSAVLTQQSELVLWGENWLNRYVVLSNMPNIEHLIIMRNELVLIDADLHTNYSINTQALQNYISTQTDKQTTDFRVIKEESFVKSIKSTVSGKIKQIKTGNDHFLILLFSDKVLGYGSNTKNQLCYSKQERFDVIQELQNTMNEKIDCVYASRNFSLVIDKDSICNIFGEVSKNSCLIRKIEVPRRALHKR